MGTSEFNEWVCFEKKVLKVITEIDAFKLNISRLSHHRNKHDYEKYFYKI